MNAITRNVTAVFVNFRRQHKLKKSQYNRNASLKEYGDTPLLADGGTNASSIMIDVSPELPPAWFDTLEEAREDISKLKDKIAQLGKAQQRRILIVFDDANSSPDVEIQNITQSISSLFRVCEEKLHNFVNSAQSSGPEQTLRRNAQRNVASQLQTLSQTFRKQQKYYMDELKRRSSQGDIFEDSPGDTTAGDDDVLSGDVEVMEQEVLVRNEELTKVAQSLSELRSLFQELATMVVDQGTVLDCIDYNIEQTVHHTEQAKQHLIKAERAQKSGCAVRCIIGLLILIGALVLVLIVKNVI